MNKLAVAYSVKRKNMKAKGGMFEPEQGVNKEAPISGEGPQITMAGEADSVHYDSDPRIMASKAMNKYAGGGMVNEKLHPMHEPKERMPMVEQIMRKRAFAKGGMVDHDADKITDIPEHVGTDDGSHHLDFLSDEMPSNLHDFSDDDNGFAYGGDIEDMGYAEGGEVANLKENYAEDTTPEMRRKKMLSGIMSKRMMFPR